MTMRILIISDAWLPQVNGVVRTLQSVCAELAAMGHVAEVIGPDRFRSLPCPTYPDIRLAVWARRRLAAMIDAFRPDALHIATEGPLGLAARSWALRGGHRFTTAFHTRFAEYVQLRTGLPTGPLYAWLRRFHNAGDGVMVATESLRADLDARGFTHLRRWSRGVDLSLFRPAPRPPAAAPVFAYVGRVAVEKNIRAFLDLDLPGRKQVTGDGPQRAALQSAYPRVEFTGPRFGPDLAAAYAAADVVVFPSRTDTFGLVILESLACATPVAAFDVPGPRDILGGVHPAIGAIGPDLRAASLAALAVDRTACRAHAAQFGWDRCARLFLSHLVPLAAPAPGLRFVA